MKVRYSDEEDILMYEVSKEPIDYAEEMDSVIVHFTNQLLLADLNDLVHLRGHHPGGLYCRPGNPFYLSP